MNIYGFIYTFFIRPKWNALKLFIATHDEFEINIYHIPSAGFGMDGTRFIVQDKIKNKFGF